MDYMEKAAINIREAVAYTGIGKDTLYRLAEEEAFPTIRLGKRTILQVAVIDRFLAENQGCDILNPSQVQRIGRGFDAKHYILPRECLYQEESFRSMKPIKKIGLTVEEAARYMSIGQCSLRQLLAWDALPVLHIGRKIILRVDTVNWFLYANHGCDLLDRAQVQTISRDEEILKK